MSEHYEYDSEKVPESKPPQRPNRAQDDREWYRWPAIIILFSTGLWPLALILMLSGGKKKKKQETHRTAAQEVMDRKRSGERSFSEKKSKNQTVSEKSRKKAEKKSKKKQKVRGKTMRIIGICLFVLGAVLCADAASSVLQGYYYALEDIFFGLGFLAGGGIMWGRGSYLGKMSRRTQRYILAIGTADTMRLSEIAKRVNRTPEKTAKELQKLIDNGFLGEDAYIDHEKGYFVRFGAEIEEPKAEPVVPKEADEGYSGILRSLRLANDRIPDAELSAKIERLEQICALIFREVEEHPEKRNRMNKFFDYYLPTTQKLLDTYAEFDEMGVEGQNVAQTKARIAEMMDAIVEGFEHQLDQLYSADAMEVASDIKVMETMLHQDTASAAKDFGYEQEKQDDKSNGIQLEL